MASFLDQDMIRVRGHVIQIFRDVSITHRNLGEEHLTMRMRALLQDLEATLIHERLWTWEVNHNPIEFVRPERGPIQEHMFDFSGYAMRPLLDDQALTEWVHGENVEASRLNFARFGSSSFHLGNATTTFSALEDDLMDGLNEFSLANPTTIVTDNTVGTRHRLIPNHISAFTETPPSEPPRFSQSELKLLNEMTKGSLNPLMILQQFEDFGANLACIPYFMLTKFIIGFASPDVLVNVTNGIDLARDAYTNLGPQLNRTAEGFASCLDGLNDLGQYGLSLRRYQLYYLRREYSRVKLQKVGQPNARTEAMDQLTKECYPQRHSDSFQSLRKRTSNRISNSKIWDKLVEEFGHQFFLSLVPTGDSDCSDHRLETLPAGTMDLAIRVLRHVRGDFLQSLQKAFQDVDSDSTSLDKSLAPTNSVCYDSEGLLWGLSQCLRNFKVFHGLT